MLRTFRLPPASQESGASWLDGARHPVVTPRRAATVLLLRDGPDGVEVFMMRRHVGMAFAGGMYVFPGGGVDPRDESGDVPWAGPGSTEWAHRLGTSPALAAALVCAAVRETFEECGVLLAGDSASTLCATDGPRWEAERQGLLAREVAMSDLLRRRGLVLRSDLLRVWAHWTTPEHEPRRYDTRFFTAVMPEEQDARHVADGEAEESGWWAAGALLDRFCRGEVVMMPPTLVALEEVAAAPDARTLWAAPREVREILPVLDRRDGEAVVVADLPEQPEQPEQPSTGTEAPS